MDYPAFHLMDLCLRNQTRNGQLAGPLVDLTTNHYDTFIKMRQNLYGPQIMNYKHFSNIFLYATSILNNVLIKFIQNCFHSLITQALRSF